MASNKVDIFDQKAHWEEKYISTQVEDLGWYEENPKPSLGLIDRCKLSQDASILNVGAGASTLIDELIKLDYTNLMVNDICPAALEKLKSRLGNDSKKVTWIVDDLLHPDKMSKLNPIDLWIDRAVLHFFIQKEEQQTYFNLLRKLVKPKGYVLIAAFNLKGAKACSGLPIHRYDMEMLQERLGAEFILLQSFDYTFTMPSGGKRDYVYTLFRRS